MEAGKDAAPAVGGGLSPGGGRSPKWKEWSRKKKLLVLFTVVASLVALGAGVLGLRTWKTLHDVAHTLPKPTVSTSTSPGSPSASVSLPSLGTQGANILVAGTSSGQAGHGGADLTDSLMVAHVSPDFKTVTLISLPRDLWVSSGGKWQKINAVEPTQGFNALATVASQVTGLQATDTVEINWTALSALVDAVGGITVPIKSPDPRGIWDPNTDLRLSNGTHHLNGQQALALTRARNDTPSVSGRAPAYGLPQGDFDRQADQRLVFDALLKQLKASSTLSNPASIYKLLQVVGGNFKTSLGQEELLSYGQAATSVQTVKSVAFTEENGLLKDYNGEDGQDALIPTAGAGNYKDLQAAVAKALK